jgi:hypothetical protein
MIQMRYEKRKFDEDGGAPPNDAGVGGSQGVSKKIKSESDSDSESNSESDSDFVPGSEYQESQESEVDIETESHDSDFETEELDENINTAIDTYKSRLRPRTKIATGILEPSQIQEIIKESIKNLIKKYKDNDKDFLNVEKNHTSINDPYEQFHELVESIYDGEFFERIPLEDRREKLKEEYTIEQINEMTNELQTMKNVYKNSSPSILDILKMKCPLEQKQKLIEKVHNLVNSETLSSEYTSNIKFLNSNISNANPENAALLELEEKILKSAVNSSIFDSYKHKILKSKMSFDNKVIAYKKLEIMETYEETDTSEYSKYKNWMDTLLSVPFGTYNDIPVKITSQETELREYIKQVRTTLDNKLSFLEKPKDQIINIIAQMIRNPSANINAIGLYGPKGVGKCHGYNTPIIMFDGTIKMVQDIKENDLLMGDDSTPRKVLSTTTGNDRLFKIFNDKGDEYITNGDHVLCLQYTANKYIYDDKKKKILYARWYDNTKYKIIEKGLSYNNNKVKEDIIKKIKYILDQVHENKITEISVYNFLKLNKTMQKNLKGYKTGIEFQHKTLDFDPYIIGFWLGDGHQHGSEITNQESTVITYFYKTLKNYNCYLSYRNNYTYNICGYKYKGYKIENAFLNSLKNNNLIKNKHIPDIYKINSRENRLKLLAGLIDSDGHYYKESNCYEINQVNEKLTDDIVYLCRSLGFACYKTRHERNWTYKGKLQPNKNLGFDINNSKIVYHYRIGIYGSNLNEIPVLCKRKIAYQRLKNQSALVRKIQIKELPKDNYYGFELDGNNRYLLGNFIVTHNTSIATSIAEALGRQLRSISLGGESDASTLTGHNFTYVGSGAGRFIEILRESKTMNPVVLIDELDKISTTQHGKEIIGTLIHLTDSTSNSKYNYDRYFSGIEFDLSKVLFIFTYNDPEKVDPILADRLYKIKVENYTTKEKLDITNTHIIKNELEKLNFDNTQLTFTEEAVNYLVNKSSSDQGMRDIKTKFKIIMSRINTLLLTEEADHIVNLKYKQLYPFYKKLPVVVPQAHIDILLDESIDGGDNSKVPWGMYV